MNWKDRWLRVKLDDFNTDDFNSNAFKKLFKKWNEYVQFKNLLAIQNLEYNVYIESIVNF